ncbi:hypothetical protein F4804DRAFT_328644 [Jackrogersella minutella]|nr:hypothetical protein F4804DRAFT_328644 [Jackrogersella minutella]
MRFSNYGLRTISVPWLVFLFVFVSDLISGLPPPTVPLLVYNCAKMPSICRNINQVSPLQDVKGTTAIGNLGLLDPGKNGGLDYITLTYDTSASNKKRRRNAACPSRWKRKHGCPETDQPPIVAAGASWSFGSYTGLRWNPNNLKMGKAGYNVIADPTNTGPSGMIWTCDEWPPAIVTQGGQAAQTYCAPQNGRCGGSQYGGTFSEQDAQASIHSVLRQRIKDTNPVPSLTGTYPFSFQTRWDDTSSAASAIVVWTNSAGFKITDSVARKRFLEQSSMFIDVVYENGTIASFARPMTEREVGNTLSSFDIYEF